MIAAPDNIKTQTYMSPLLERLVDRLHAALDNQHDIALAAARAAMALRPFLGHPLLLQPAQREADPTRYRQHILYVADDGRFSIVALVWLPGQATPIPSSVLSESVKRYPAGALIGGVAAS